MSHRIAIWTIVFTVMCFDLVALAAIVSSILQAPVIALIFAVLAYAATRGGKAGIDSIHAARKKRA